MDMLLIIFYWISFLDGNNRYLAFCLPQSFFESNLFIIFSQIVTNELPLFEKKKKLFQFVLKPSNYSEYENSMFYSQE